MQLFQTGYGMNYGDYHNPQYDALIDQASSTNDAAKRLQLFHKLKHLQRGRAAIPVYFYVSAHLIKPYVKGWQSNVMDRYLSRYMYILAHQES